MKHKEGTGESRSLRARLRDGYRSISGQNCRIEQQSDRSVIVQGCCGIDTYTESCIVLCVKDPTVRAVCICGNGLRCSSYHPDGVVVEGCIKSVAFCTSD